MTATMYELALSGQESPARLSPWQHERGTDHPPFIRVAGHSPGSAISPVTSINAMLPPGAVPSFPMTDIYPLP